MSIDSPHLQGMSVAPMEHGAAALVYIALPELMTGQPVVKTDTRYMTCSSFFIAGNTEVTIFAGQGQFFSKSTSFKLNFILCSVLVWPLRCYSVDDLQNLNLVKLFFEKAQCKASFQGSGSYSNAKLNRIRLI